MSYQEKNITVTLVNFTLILVFYLIRVFQLIQYERFDTTHVFRLWGIVVVAAIVVTVLALIAPIVIAATMEPTYDS